MLNAILGLHFDDLRGLCNYFTSLLATSTKPNVSASEASNELVKICAAHYEHTLFIGDKEASGRVILGLFIEAVREALHKRHPNRVFKLDHAFKVLPRKGFATGEAMVVAVIGQDRKEVVFALEI